MAVEFNKEIYENCGTYAGAQQHNRRKTPKCGPCLQAAREYAKEYRHKTGQSKGTWVYVPDGDSELLATIQGLLAA